VSRAWVLALALLVGCPASSDPPSTGVDPAQRTANAERAQAQSRLDDLSQSSEVPAEALAVKALRTWLRQPRQWRAEGYRVRVRRAPTHKDHPPGPPLTRAEVEALITTAKPVTLVLEVPYFPPTVPTATRAFLAPESLGPLLPFLVGLREQE
jgi:hypothetical protein